MSSVTTAEKVVLVTGAAGRLGTAIVEALAARGAWVIAADRMEAPLGELARRLARVDGVVADVGDEPSVVRMVEQAVARGGHLDGCVNAAGIEGPVLPVESLDAEQVRDVFDINVLGTMRVMKHSIAHLRSRGEGRIVNVASGAGLGGTAYMAAYSASKHAVVGLTRSAALELAATGIAVNAVCPGCIESPMMQRIEAAIEEWSKQPVSFAAAIPAGRMATPAEVAEVTAYLALDAPVYMTGTAVVVDGGLRV